MQIKRFLKDPIHSLQKEWRNVKGKYFVKEKSKQIRQSRIGKNASENLDILFPDQREKFETDIEKIKHIAVKILLMLEYLGKKHNFQYFLAYGTLLGAIRHNGFIPWDDDIDIMMTKKDLEKLISVAYELPDSLTFFPMSNNFMKVMDKYSKMSKDGKRGVAIDIFVLDDEKKANYSFINVHSLRAISLSQTDVFPLKKHAFEEVSFFIPNDADKILTSLYGDYMKLPPIEQRVSHHVNDTSVHIYPFPK